jgi:hypothetical protein
MQLKLLGTLNWPGALFNLFEGVETDGFFALRKSDSHVASITNTQADRVCEKIYATSASGDPLRDLLETAVAVDAAVKSVAGEIEWRPLREAGFLKISRVMAEDLYAVVD